MTGRAEDYERAMAFADIALGQMKALRQAATPRNYEVWYAYATGYHPSLNQQVNATLKAKGTYFRGRPYKNLRKLPVTGTADRPDRSGRQSS